MLQFFSKYKFLGIVLFVLSAIIIAIIYSILKPKEVLPIFQPAQVNTEMVDSTLQHVKKYHTVADFKLANVKFWLIFANFLIQPLPSVTCAHEHPSIEICSQAYSSTIAKGIFVVGR